jgi:hypothetical protein
MVDGHNNIKVIMGVTSAVMTKGNFWLFSIEALIG